MLRVKQQIEPHTNFTWSWDCTNTHIYLWDIPLNAHCQPPNSPPHLELILGSLFLTRGKFPKKRNRKTRGGEKKIFEAINSQSPDVRKIKI